MRNTRVIERKVQINRLSFVIVVIVVVLLGRSGLIILIVAKTEEKTAIMRSILEKAGPDTPAKAIAFSLPTTEVAGFGFYRNNEA